MGSNFIYNCLDQNASIRRRHKNRRLGEAVWVTRSLLIYVFVLSDCTNGGVNSMNFFLAILPSST